MRGAVGLRERAPGLVGQRRQEQPLVGGGPVPEVAEVRMLGAQELRERGLETFIVRGLPRAGLGPEEIAELLGGVRMPAGRLPLLLRTAAGRRQWT